MADKNDFAARLARIEERHATGGPELPAELTAMTPDAPQQAATPKGRRWGVAIVSICLGLGFVGFAVVLTLNKIETDTPGTKALIAEKLSNGEPVNFLEILTRANVGEDKWNDAQTAQTAEQASNSGTSELSDLGRFILDN